MTTNASTGDKTEFWLHDGTALVELGEIIDVPEFPNFTRDLIKASHMKSGNFEDYISAPRSDGAETTIAMNLIPNGTTALLCKAARLAGNSRTYKIGYFTDAGVKRMLTGSLIVRGYVEKNPMEDRRTAELTVKWTTDATDAVFA